MVWDARDLKDHHRFQEDQIHDLARHRGESDWPVVPWVFLFSLCKNGDYVSSLLISRNFTGLPQLLKYDGRWFSNYIHQFLQDPWMYLIRSHGLVHLQALKMVSYLIFSYTGQFIILPVSAFAFWGLGHVSGALVSEDWGKIVVKYLSLLHIPGYQVSYFLPERAPNFLSLPFITKCTNLIDSMLPQVAWEIRGVRDVRMPGIRLGKSKPI